MSEFLQALNIIFGMLDVVLLVALLAATLTSYKKVDFKIIDSSIGHGDVYVYDPIGYVIGSDVNVNFDKSYDKVTRSATKAI